ncbi:nitroreductase [Planomonospora sphaerica]|uniref:Nitroreductase n=1 Tax=Planomonospora sphaerica TaxID=161355 RepID=A0A161LL62_9ACTN|nr:nitroreductase family protein [Planomonospora sphaerica]GAT69517.1 nitroreductase [Planomonospora sphaerica]
MKTHIAPEITDVLHAAAEAAAWAPSVHNTQPWSFAVSGDELCVRADPDRKLRLGDETGREMLIGCGAALLNARIALRAAGYEPLVRVLPDPDRPSLLATVRPGPHVAADEHTALLRAEIERRRTHRAGFSDVPVSDELLEELVAQPAAEGATLTVVRSPAAVRVLAALTAAAQEIQSQDRRFSLEVMRWARPSASPRADGVPADAYPREAATTEPHFAQRDYADGHGWGSDADQRMATSTGTVAVLTTSDDTRQAWICAGQALQRMLLHASAYGVSAAFHTQALEMPLLREVLRQELCSGEHPQMIMRLGIALDEAPTARRPLAETLEEDPGPRPEAPGAG